MALTVEGLTKEFTDLQGHRRLRAVDNISFEIAPGEILGLLGPNGAGKTTTIRMICDLVKPTAGRITINGYVLGSQRAVALSHLGVVLEGKLNLYGQLTVQENLVYFAGIRGLRPRQIRARSEALIRSCGLWEHRDRTVQTLSRGMQQKVAVAVALVTDSSMLLLDEPTVALDVQSAEEVKRLVLALAHEQGKAILLTTHQMDLAQAICDRIAIIDQGRIVTYDTFSNLRTLFQTPYYQIRARGYLSDQHQDNLLSQDSSEVIKRNGFTEIRLLVRDPRVLYRTFQILEKAGLTVDTVQREEPDLKEIFARIVWGDYRR